MTTENTETTNPQRESIWSVPIEYRVLYFSLFIIQSLTGMSYVVWHEVWINDGDSFHSTVTAIILMDVAVIAHSAGIGVIVSEMKMVIAQYLEQRYYGPKRRKALAEAEAKGREEGVKQGREQGVAQGRAETAAKFREWNARRLEADAKGEPFDEPPPLDDEPAE